MSAIQRCVPYNICYYRYPKPIVTFLLPIKHESLPYIVNCSSFFTSDQVFREGCSIQEMQFESLNVDFRAVVGYGANGTVYKGTLVGQKLLLK